MATLNIGTPNAKQRQFLADTHKYIAFGGARGGGKSWSVRAKIKVLAYRYAGCKMLLVRTTYPELLQNHILTLLKELHGFAKYNKQDKLFTFSNGSTLKMGYCNNDSDMSQYQGAEFDFIFLDEACLLDESWIKDFQACLRGANDFPKRIYYTLNPGGRSHGYFKRLFIDREYKDGENPDDYSFIQSLVTDNTVLMDKDPDYIKRLQALPPKRRAAWLEGRWDVFAGQVFEMFTDDAAHYEDRRYTHVIAPFPPVAGWKIYRSFDWGSRRPFSCGWWAIDYDGIMYRIAELYGCTGEPNEGVRWEPTRVFSEIKRIENDHPWLRGQQIQGVADPAIWDKDTGISIEEMAAKQGVYFQKGDHKRIAGWMQCQYRLAFDDEGYPRMYVFSTCRDFIRTIPLMMYDEHKVEDVDSKLEDHIADEWRYMCMARPITPRLPVKRILPDSDPLNQYRDSIQNRRRL